MACGYQRQRLTELGVIKGRANVITENIVVHRRFRLQLAMENHAGLQHRERISVFNIRRQSAAISFFKEARLGNYPRFAMISCCLLYAGCKFSNGLMLKKVLQRKLDIFASRICTYLNGPD